MPCSREIITGSEPKHRKFLTTTDSIFISFQTKLRYRRHTWGRSPPCPREASAMTPCFPLHRQATRRSPTLSRLRTFSAVGSATPVDTANDPQIVLYVDQAARRFAESCW